MESSNNKLTMSEARNNMDTISSTSAFIEGATKQGDRPIVRRTSLSISRRKLSIFVSVAVAVVIIILVIIIPILGLRKSG